MQVVLFKTREGTTAVLAIAPDMLEKVSIYALAKRLVPEGCPYWIVDRESLPKDVPIEAIILDESARPPDGYGQRGIA
jgi:hypothetical protein